MSTRSVEGTVEQRARSDVRTERDQTHRAGAECSNGQIWSDGVSRGGNIAINVSLKSNDPDWLLGKPYSYAVYAHMQRQLIEHVMSA
jgi:hypothetical protein